MKILKLIKNIVLGLLVIAGLIINIIIFFFVKEILYQYTSPWEIFEVVRRAAIKYYDFKGLSFVDDQNGIMWGEYLDEDMVYSEDGNFARSEDGSIIRSIKEEYYFILESKDSGKNWRQIYKSENEIISISHVSDKLFYALAEVRPKGNSRGYFQILKFENDSDSFKFNSFENISQMHGLMSKIFFLNSEVGFILGYKEQNVHATITMMTKDGGKNWQTLQLNYKPDRHKQFIKYDESKLYYFYGDRLILLDIDSMKEDVIEFPQEEMNIIHICLDDKKRLWLLAESDTIMLFKQKDNNDFEKIVPSFGKKKSANKKLSPEIVHVYDNKIFVFLVDYSSYFPPWEFYMSADDGLTWKEEKMPISIASRLIAFHKDNIWVYSYWRKLQHRHY